LWNITSNGNWSGGGQFFTGDSITFEDTATGNDNGGVEQRGWRSGADVLITVNNGTKDYTFSGSGAITGTTSLTKSGTGSLRISTTNTFSGGVNLNAGLLILGNARALG